VLDKILARLPQASDPNLLVGTASKDDAGVYLVRPDLALVQTTDFFTPIVDDPYSFGQIAAANSLSDVYAMGGTPITALTILCYPEDGDMDVLERILRGGFDKMAEAGCTIAGGHSVRDEEIKFGYAVTGTIDPARIWTNCGAQPDDVIILTKPVGTGVITTALRAGEAQKSWVDAATAVMSALNRTAAATLAQFSATVHAVTDITGFGLLGHAFELASGSKVSLTIDHGRIAWIEGALECAKEGYLAGGVRKNRDFVGDCVFFGPRVPADIRDLMFDPQTSGGLLIAVPGRQAGAVKDALIDAGCEAAVIGEVAEKGKPLISVS
jgi:selenide, water dikinase